MERDILTLRQELDAIEEQYRVQSKVAELEATLATERAAVQALVDKLAGIKRLLGLPPDDGKEDSDPSSTNEDEVHLVVRGPKHQCADCAKTFSARQYLVRHQNLTGHGGSPYTCPQCHEGFTTQGHLARHLTKEEHHS
jgi:predicted RNA-binding Zn-ribbon protein involved in translation (DUF1610 family)